MTLKAKTIKALLAFFLVSFSLGAFSQGIFFTIQPKSADPANTLFVLESAEFELVLENTSDTTAKNIEARISGSREMAFIQDNEEKKELKMTFLEVKKGERAVKTFMVKPLYSSPRKAEIKADWAINGATQSYSIFLPINESSINFSPRLEKTAIAPLEKNSAIFDISNPGQNTLKDILVRLELPEGFSVKNQTFALKELSPSQAVQNARLEFSAGEEGKGEQTATIVLLYTEGTKRHEIRKPLVVDVRKRDNSFWALAIVAIAIAAIVFFFSQKNKGNENAKVHKEQHGHTEDENAQHNEEAHEQH